MGKLDAFQKDNLDKQWNVKIVQHIKRLRGLTKPSPMFPNTIREACETYLTICEEDMVKPSISGLSYALGVNRATLLKWVNGEVSVECADVVQEYFNLIEIVDETALKEGKTNAISGIFFAKNNFGYKDQVEHKIVDERDMSDEEILALHEKRMRIVGEVDMSEQTKLIENKTNKTQKKAK